MTVRQRRVTRSNMWDSLLSLIPEKRQPGALSILAFCSITLPILAAVTALAAWKLNDRLTRQRLPASAAARDLPASASAIALPDPTAKKALDEAQSNLRESQMALHEAEAQLELEKERSKVVIAAATHRHLSTAQRQRFIRVGEKRPKGRVSVVGIEGDAECMAYAEEIRGMLLAAGYEVPPELGTIQLREDTVVGIRVGAYSKETAPLHALPLSTSFIECDIFAPAVINQRVARGEVEVMVGTNPAAMTDDLPSPEAPAPANSNEKVVAPK